MVSGPNKEFCWTTVYESGGGVYCAHAMAAVARYDSMSLFGIDNLLWSSYRKSSENALHNFSKAWAT